MTESEKSQIKVSIVCNAYNHEIYIADALEGFVMQKTDFAFEILVHDDASTDKTADIIRKYEKRYPELIKPIYETENLYSKKDGSLSRVQYGRVKGKYVALCEGDDYWTDPYKLQKQYDAMESHPEVDMCAHRACKIDAATAHRLGTFPNIPESRILTQEEIIYGDGDFLSTNSLFYRSELNKEPPRFRKFWNIDYTLQIYGALRGGILFLNDVMSVYRYMSKGSWTSRISDNVEKKLNIYDTKQQMLNILNNCTDGRYSNIIIKRQKKNEWEMLDFTDQHKKRIDKSYAEFVDELSLKGKIKLYVKAWLPWVLAVKRKLQNTHK